MSIKAPDISDEDSIHGQVIASYEVDTNCVYGNVRIEKSLSALCDAAVIKTMNDLIKQLNRCMTVCVFKHCKKQKWFQPFNFTSGD